MAPALVLGTQPEVGLSPLKSVNPIGHNGLMTLVRDIGRFPLLGWSFVLTLMFIPSALLLTFLSLSISLVSLGVGIPLTIGTVALLRRFADTHRLWAGRVLGVSITRPYRPAVQGGWLTQLKADLQDPATWRDVGWLLVNGTVGCPLCGGSFALFAAGIGGLALPLIWYFLPAGTAVTFNFFFLVHDVASAARVGFAEGLFYLLLWWLLAPRLMGWYASLNRRLLMPTEQTRLASRVRQLTESRAETVDAQAAELRRIERDLHDGAQARLVALGMSLGMAEGLMARDPKAAHDVLAEARESTGAALSELRDLVRGIHPPVLADRGLEGAIRALALAGPLPVDVNIRLTGRPAPPVESAAYLAVAETLTNVAKHSGAASVWIRVGHENGRLTMVVGDDGRGGAASAPGGGLHGIERRLAAFDGTMVVSSPLGGPTVVTMELPCALSSPKTSPYSETA